MGQNKQKTPLLILLILLISLFLSPTKGKKEEEKEKKEEKNCKGGEEECLVAPFVTEGVNSGRTRSSIAQFSSKNFPNSFFVLSVLELANDLQILPLDGESFLSGPLAVTTTGEIIGSIIRYPSTGSNEINTSVEYYMFAANVTESNKLELLWVVLMIQTTLPTPNLESVNRCFTPSTIEIESGVRIALSCPVYGSLLYDHKTTPTVTVGGASPSYSRGPTVVFNESDDIRVGGYSSPEFVRIEDRYLNNARFRTNISPSFTFSTARAVAEPSQLEPNPIVWMGCGSMNETTNQDMPPNRDTIDDCSSATEAGDVILGYAPLVGDYETVCVLISPDGEMGFGVGASLMKVDDQHTQVNFVVFGFDSQPTVEQPAETLWVIFERDSSFVVGGDLLSVSSLDIPCPALATMPRSEQDGESDGLEDDFVLYVSFLNGSFYALSGQIGSTSPPSQKWKIESESPFSPLLVSNNSQLLVTLTDKVLLLDVDNGKTLKSVKLPKDMTAMEAATPYRTNQFLIPTSFKEEEEAGYVVMGKFKESSGDGDVVVWVVAGVLIAVIIVGASVGGYVYFSREDQGQYEAY